MVKEVKQIDESIFEHGNKLINGSKVKKVRPVSGLQSFLDDVVQPNTKPSTPSSAKNIKATLKRITNRTPEVMVKVTGGGNSSGKIQAHMNYITRNGQLEAEDQDGNKIKGKEDIQDAADEWRMSGDPILDDESKYKQAFNIVLSMPKGTNEQAVYEAAKEFAEKHFTDHKYLMAQHTYSNDPNKNPSENPHVHIVVKAVSDNGVRLDPKKADLQKWRETFAEKLREHGVEANATKRIHRMQKTRGQKQSIYQMKAKGRNFKNYGQGKASVERTEKAKNEEKEAINNYKNLSKALAQGDQDDRKLAVDIVDFLSKQLNVNPSKTMEKPKQDIEKVKSRNKDFDR